MDNTADNVDEIVEPIEQPASPAEPKDLTKAFSERLNKERVKIAADTRLEIAKSLGYESYEEFMDAQTDSKLMESGLDPESVKPLLKDMLVNDPSYVELQEYKQREEAKAKERWAHEQLEALNTKYGLALTSVDELDQSTVEYWNSGVPLDKAYAVNHFDEIQETAIKQAQIAAASKQHLTNPSTDGGTTTTERILTDAEIEMFKRYNPNATDEDIKKFVNQN